MNSKNNAAYLFMICFFLSSIIVKAQEKERYIVAGPGWSFTSVQDYGMSPLIYGGHNFWLHLGYNKFTSKVNNLVDGYMRVGYVQTINNDETPASALYFKTDIDYRHERAIPGLSNNKYQFLLGGEWNNTFGMRLNSAYSNNALNYEVITSLGVAPTLKTSYEIFNHQVDLGLRLTIPLIAAVIRPGYSSTQPEAFITEDKYFKALLKSFNVVSWGNYFRLKSGISATYHFNNNNNAIRLTYLWDYFSYDKIPENRIRTGIQGLNVTTLLSF